MSRRTGKPFQFGLNSLFWLVVAAGLMCWLGKVAWAEADSIWGALATLALMEIVVIGCFWLVADDGSSSAG